MLDGYSAPYIYAQASGEVGLFWGDLTSAALIEGNFSANSSCTGSTPSGTELAAYFPTATIGGGNYVYVFETKGSNWFGLALIKAVVAGQALLDSWSMSVADAANIDAKTDDGIPTTGNVQAIMLYGTNNQSVSNPSFNDIYGLGDTPTTCYSVDYSNLLNSHYSVNVNNGVNPNCSISFKFQ